MGAIDNFAEDINGILADLETQFRRLHERKLRLKERGGDIATRWTEYLDSQDKALQTAEDALNRISNVPVSKAPERTIKETLLSKVPVMGKT